MNNSINVAENRIKLSSHSVWKNTFLVAVKYMQLHFNRKLIFHPVNMKEQHEQLCFVKVKAPLLTDPPSENQN